MSTETIAHLVGSDQGRVATNDSLKDDDNAAWVLRINPIERLEWIERMSWIRLVDRLAESELVDGCSSGFVKFHSAWKHLLETRRVNPEGDYQGILTKLHHRWFQPDHYDRHSIQAWDRYVDAVTIYHQPNLVLSTLADHEQMLQCLAGSFSQILPFLPQQHRQAVFQFGVLDQFYNNLRDLAEDLSLGICYFPTTVLEQHHLTRQDLLALHLRAAPNYQQLIQFWLDEYLPSLRQRTMDIVQIAELPPSWQLLRDWSLHRYDRIERVFRQCDYDVVAFSHAYWQEVSRYLGSVELPWHH